MTTTDDGLDEVFYTLAARKVRHLLETAVAPRVSYMLQRAVAGHPVPACRHITSFPGDGDPEPSGIAVIDWMCEGVGILCQECAIQHLGDPTTPHRDPRHECCIVCGHGSADDLRPLRVRVSLREDAMVASDRMRLFSALHGATLARSVGGDFLASPVAWECVGHDGFLDSEVTLIWPPVLPVERHVVRIKKAKGGKRGKRRKRDRKR